MRKGVHPPKHTAIQFDRLKSHNDVDVLKTNTLAILSDDMSKDIEGASTPNLKDSMLKTNNDKQS